jgi:sugar lactone lactonase YvrE
VTALAPLADGLLLADARARCLRRYTHAGEHVGDIGHDNRMKGFLIPNGVLDFAVDEQGVIHVANPGKHRVERYSAAGELLGHFGRFDGRDPAGFAGCCNPTNLTVAGSGRVFVTEKAGPRVKAYDGTGALLAVIADEVFDPRCKNMDLAVDDAGRIYVVDTALLSIRVFEVEPTGGTDER